MGINLPNGAEVGEIVLPDGSQTSEVIAPDGSTVWGRVAIPDTSVSRGADDSTTTQNGKFGLQITTSQEWPEIGAVISSQTSGLTTAYVFRSSDGQLMGSTDISSLSAGDSFMIDLDTNLSPDTTYNFVADAADSDFTLGYLNSPTFPFTSDDDNLEISNGAEGEQDTSANANCFVTIGNV